MTIKYWKTAAQQFEGPEAKRLLQQLNKGGHLGRIKTVHWGTGRELTLPQFTKILRSNFGLRVEPGKPGKSI